MSEFDEARRAAIAWIHAQIDRYGLSFDDLEAAGCFDAPLDEPADAAASAESAEPTRTANAAPNPSAEPAPRPVLYRNAMGQSWDGTGEMPDWLQRAVNAGQTPEFYRVN